MARVLVIEDEARLRTFLSRTLQTEGHTVATAETGPDGVHRAMSQAHDLIILDLMLPGFDGFEVLRRVLEREPDQRVLVLSAVDNVAARVRCLRMGAVDFLSKPFAAAELVERTRVRLRSPAVGDAERWLRVNGFALDLERQTLDIDGVSVSLSQREFLLLEHLMRRAGLDCSRADLLAEVWGYTEDSRSNVVDVTVRRLRGKIPRSPIETVRNVGYVFSIN